MKPPDRVLVIFPGALGDLICLTPVLSVLRRRHRDASLELMARDELVRLAIGRLGINCGESIDRREVGRLFIDASLTERIDLFRGFSRVYSFFGADDSTFRKMLSDAASDATVSFHPFRPVNTSHIATAYLDSIGARAVPVESRLDLLDADRGAATSLLAGLDLDPVNFALVFPGSGSHAKNWPYENFVAMAARLARKIPVLFILGPAEAEFAPRLRTIGLPMLSGLELPIVAAIAAQARLFIGNDSGVSHLAAAAGAAGLVIFGPTDPARWRPLGQVQILSRMPLEALAPGEVMATAESLWARQIVNGRHETAKR
ncbi:MAG TPA: glycosyltransferase family 9 protein [Candidatus Binataceae bacterium]|nr:glycosyltransferase family 9 protein [Candidatus Binataceae bacterium]